MACRSVLVARSVFAAAMALSLGAGCPAETNPGGGGTGGSTGGDGIDPTKGPITTDPTSPSTGAVTTADGSGTSEGPPPGTDSGGSDGAGSTGGGPPPVPTSETPCGNDVYQCGDLVDNDGDGFIDLFDPECTGPCDNDESSFATGLPGDNMDCKQDCFFDGNSGQGDDGCIWDLRCDPANPGANIGCEYTGGQNCNNQPPNQDADCIAFCSQFVPPGCDCFGCCTVQTPEGDVDIFLNSGPDCAIDNLEACLPCTSQIDDCGNTCEPEMCEICFGETDPPPGCGMQSCENDLPCMFNEDCPTDFYCLNGCCYPPPPG